MSPRRSAAAQPGSMVDRVHETVRAQIVSGAYAPGSKLSAAGLATDNDVSVIPVREALRRLEAERLVVVSMNTGATVASVSSTDLLDLSSTRTVLECYTLREAAPHHTEASLAAVSALLPLMLKALHVGSVKRVSEIHRRFHFDLYVPAQRPWTIHLIDQLWHAVERYVRMTPDLRPSPEDYVAEHARIVDALIEGDVEEAVQRLRAHLWRSFTLLSTILIERERAAGLPFLADVPAGPPSVG